MNPFKLVLGFASILEGLDFIGQALQSTFADTPAVKSYKPLAGVSNIPVRDIEKRIEKINEVLVEFFSDPKKVAILREFVLKDLTARCGDRFCVPERDWKKEVETVYEFVRKNVRYTRDVWSIDTFQSPLATLKYHAGDCDDIAILIMALLLIIGIRGKWIVVRTKMKKGNKFIDAPDFNHIYVGAIINVNGKDVIIPLDASLPAKPGWEVPKEFVIEKRFFDIPRNFEKKVAENVE
jgi:hypothetical protein